MADSPAPTNQAEEKSTSLQIAQPTELKSRRDTSLILEEWDLAKAEFGRRYPRLSKAPGWLALLLFTVLGLSPLAIASFFYGFLPWYFLLITPLSLLVIGQLFVINLAGAAHERVTEQLKAEHEGEKEAIRTELQKAELKCAELTKCKIKFKLNEVSTRVYVDVPSSYNVLTVTAKLKIQFENEDIHPWTMKGLRLTLHELEPPDLPEIYTLIVGEEYIDNSTKQPIPREQFEGMLIQGGKVSPWYTCKISIVTVQSEKKVTKPEDLTNAHFLRLSMEASNQEPLTSNMFINWSDAATSLGASVISLGAPAIRIHENRRLGTLDE